MRIYYCFFISFLFYGCFSLGCEYEYVGGHRYFRTEKKITIINHTHRTYTKNGLYSLMPITKKGNSKWKLNSTNLSHQKINTIKPKRKIDKDEKGKSLKLETALSCTMVENAGWEKVFLFSLDGGKNKIFFGVYNYEYDVVWRDDDKECKRYFVRFDNIHPVWQEKELTIHIYGDKIEFSDPKIKETKKLRLTETEYADLKTLPLILSNCD